MKIGLGKVKILINSIFFWCTNYPESVGKNNRYGHPKDEVLETLKNSKIYRTDLDGSIEIKLNKNGYKIRTCPP